MRVQRRDVATVLNDDRVAVAIFFASEDNFPVTGRIDRCATGRRVIDATMCANSIENWMFAPRIETGTDASEINRRAYERFSNAQSLRRVVVRSPALVDITNRLKRTAVVVELSGDNIAISDVSAILIDFLKQNLIVVAAPDVQNKIHIPGEDASQVHYQFIR